MRTIYVSPDFPLNRRMRKDIRRGKLQVVREGGERLSLGGGIPSGKRRAFRTFSSPLVCMADNGAEVGGGGLVNEQRRGDKCLTPTAEQAQSIRHGGASVRLVAGPGTGKTFTLTERVAHLVIEKGVPPEKIQLISFTRMTARDLQESVVERLKGEGKTLPRVSTLHSYALRQLVASGESKHELPQPLCIADDWEEKNIIRKDLKFLCGIGLKEIDGHVKKMSSDWATLKADESGWDKTFPNASFMGAWNKHRRAYGYTLRAELVYRLKELFSRRGDYSSKISVPHHLLVDEYQDLNHCDITVIRKFVDLGAKLFIAGDDDQSIYGFRDAHPAGIRNFLDEYKDKGAVSLSLGFCQRCPENILALGEYVIEQQENRGKRIPKKISAEKSGGGVDILNFSNEKSESRGIAEICRSLIVNDGIAPGRILILLRGDRHHKFSNPLVENLKSLEIGAARTNPSNPLNGEEGRTLLAFMRLAISRKDSLAWRTILALWCKRIGDRTIDAYYQRTNHAKNFAQVLLELHANGMGELSNQRDKSFFSQIDNVLNKIEALFPQEALEPKETPEEAMAVVRAAATDLIKSENKRGEVLQKFQQIADLVGAVSVKSLVEGAKDEHTTEEQGEDGEEDTTMEDNKVNILTMHKAKGLTAEVVIVAAAEDENISEKSNEEEECRLFYVSLTRAKSRLLITYCDHREGAQKYSGRRNGRVGRSGKSSRRKIIRFLAGCPHESQKGEEFVRKLNG